MNKLKTIMKKNVFIVVLVVALIIAILDYFLVSFIINKDLGLVEIPISNQTIPESTLITEDMITTISISKDLLPKGIYVKSSGIVGKYVNSNATIPANGFFYSELLSDTSKAMGEGFKELKEGEFAYTIKINKQYDQKLFKENQYINIYVIFDYSTLGSNSSIFGQLASNVRLIEISKTDSEEYITLALTEEQIGYFALAESKGATIIPLVNSGSDGENLLPSDYYDINRTLAWLKSTSNIYEIPESLRNSTSEEVTEEDNLTGGMPLN